MNNTFRIEIKPKEPLIPDVSGQAILSEIRDFGIKSIHKVETFKVYQVDGIKSQHQEQILKNKLFVEPLWLREETVNKASDSLHVLEISLKPGVTDTEIESIFMAAKDLGFKITSAESRRKFILWGRVSKQELATIIDKILMNKTIERVVEGKQHKFTPQMRKGHIDIIPLCKFTDQKLTGLSQRRILNLTLSEMQTIKKYFEIEKRDPSDCELETIAQTWSEHCFHKTFKSKIRVGKKIKPSFIERIKTTTQEINHPDCLVTFSDNAGIVSFNDTWAFCAKTETHNSPSAIEPYGGAMTGSGGVFRDIAASGLGAKNIASSDIFCFGHPEMSQKDVPQGCLHPKRIMQKCVAGVRDYGNRLGVPTINGSMTFDANYRAKPTVLVGGFGVMPKKYTYKKKIKKGDLIVSIGGKTGRDGIHGATFSSTTMTEETEVEASSAVQIGNPIEEKKMFDALLAARDAGIIKNIADCGGGGYSSSVGEMGKDIGVWVDLARVELKYSGLSAWEIWLSESQERMVIALDKKNLSELKKFADLYNTSFTVLGHFTGKGRLELVYKDKKVADLSMKFLFEGIPQKVLDGEYIRNIKYQISNIKKKEEINYLSVFKKILSNLNVASKEEIVRRYDHEVQGRLVLKPFLGTDFDGPQDGAIVKPLFESIQGLSLSHGLAVGISKLDPYWGAIYAVDEAVRNQIAMGTALSQIFLLDNFIFPTPNNKVLGDLDLAVDGICDAALVFQTPFISGKDSLSGTYKNKDLSIEVPPTTIVSSVGKVADVTKTSSSDFKTVGNNVYLVGKTAKGLAGSIYENESKLTFSDIPQFNLKLAKVTYQRIHQAVKKQFIVSCHDISEGGMLVTLAEMCFGADLGVIISLDNLDDKNLSLPEILFSESGGRFIVEVDKKYAKKFKNLLKGIPHSLIGKVQSVKNLKVTSINKTIINENIKVFKKIWQASFRKYF